VRTALATLSAAALLAGGCSGGSTTPHASPTPSTTSGSSLSAIAEQLRALATAGSSATYTAFYRIHQVRPASTGTVRVWRGQPSVRVDIVVGRNTASLIVTPKASFSCTAERRRRVCFRVAGPGRAIPPPFNLAPQTLFAADVRQLASDIRDYTVTAGSLLSAHGSVPAATCFVVAPTAAATKPQVSRGTYCFATSGVLTAVTYPSGNTLELTALRLGQPPAYRFRPYAHATPLPG
jgi:hypothetical protein